MHRRYLLSPQGRKVLEEAATRNKPWLKSTGPRTASGKRRASTNALTHGERAAENGRRRQIIKKMLAVLRARRPGEAIEAKVLDELRTSWGN
jgi:hypothetical protein